LSTCSVSLRTETFAGLAASRAAKAKDKGPFGYRVESRLRSIVSGSGHCVQLCRFGLASTGPGSDLPPTIVSIPQIPALADAMKDAGHVPRTHRRL
jgi:hypothetical protein